VQTGHQVKFYDSTWTVGVNQELTRLATGSIAAMRISYLLSFETYKKLQPPFEAIEPVGRGLFFFLYLMTIEVGVGVAMLSGQLYSLLRRLPAPEPGWFASVEIFGFGASLFAGVWVFRKLSARRAVREQGEFFRESYARLHCRDRRFVETTQEGLVFGCDCKTEADTWADVLSWGEMDGDFVLWTRRNITSIPREAFLTEGERTQFQATLSEHVGGISVAVSRSVEFCANRGDWRRAKWLMFRRGGWVRSGGLLLWALCVAVFILIALPFFGANDVWSAPGLIGACAFTLAAAFLLDPLRRGPYGWTIPMKVWFAKDAIYIRSDKFALRIPWGMIVWCQADAKTLLFCYRPGCLLLIPLRAIPVSQLKHILLEINARLPRSSSA